MLGLVRSTDPQTSYDAALVIYPQLKKIQARVMMLFNHYGPMIDEELRARYTLHYGFTAESTIRTRRSELVRLGLVEPTNATRSTASGLGAMVWALRPPQSSPSE